MFEVGRLVARIALDGAQTFTRDLRQIGKEFQGLSSDGKAAAREVGTSLAAVGASIFAVSALAVKAAIDWETAWTGVTKTVSGTPAELAAVEDGLRGLTAVLPATHTEIAAVAEAAGQLGIKTPAIVAFTRTMIDLGETTNLSSEEAATSLARFMNVMGTAQADVSRLGSVIVELGNNYATTEAEIMAMGSRLSGASRQIGLSEGQTLGLAAALSSVGIEAEAGGSAMSKVMIDIAASVDKGGDRVEQFAKIAGMSADEFSQKWRTAPGEALASFVSGLANAESQGESTLGMLEQLGISEVRMRDALLRSAAASDQFAEAMGTGTDAFAENNALTEEAAKRYATVESKLRIAGNAINDTAISFGENLLPAISAAADAAVAISGFMGDLPSEWQGAIMVVGLAAGAVALFGGAALLAIPKIVEFRIAVRVLAAEMPILTRNLGAARAMMTGPWAGALIIAALGVEILTNHLRDMQATTEDVTAAFQGARKASDVFAVTAAGNTEWIQTFASAKVELSDLDTVLEKAAEQSTNLWSRLGDSSIGPALKQLKTMGESLADMASTDLPAAQDGFRMLADETDGTHTQMWRLLSEMPALRDELEQQALAMGLLTSETSDAERQQILLELATGDGAIMAETAADAYLEQADATAEARSSLEELIDVMNEHNGIGQDAISLNIEYLDSVAALDENIQKAREGVEGYALTLDQSTAAGRENMGALLDMASSAWDAAEAQHALDGDTAAYQARLQQSRSDLLLRINDLGVTGAEAEALADKILKIPSTTEWEVIANTANAQFAIDRFLAANANKRVHVAVGVGGAGGITEADGGRVHYYANGGREQHTAQIARAGVTRVWAEPETGGELYAPLSPHKRARSMAIIGQQLAEWGYDIQPRGGAQHFADGGNTGPRSPIPAGPGRMVIEGELDLGDGLTGRIRGTVVDILDDATLDALGGTNR